jgi:hypothetical protein
MYYIRFLTEYRTHFDRNAGARSTLTAHHLPLGLFAPAGFASAFSAFRAANG